MQTQQAQLATLQRVFDEKGRVLKQTTSKRPHGDRPLSDHRRIRGWLFTINIGGAPAYVVARIDYTPPNNDETGKIFVELKANAKGDLSSVQVRIAAADIVARRGRDFRRQGFSARDAELIEAYDSVAERYFAWRGRYARNFPGPVSAFRRGPDSTHRNTDWARRMSSSCHRPAARPDGQ